MLKWLEAIRRFSNDKIIVLLMTTNWCENCKKQSEILRDLELEREFSDNFVFVEEDADERIDLAIRYTPQIYPCISIINKDTILGGTYGLVEKDKLKEILLLTLDIINRDTNRFTTAKRAKSNKFFFDAKYIFNDIVRKCEAYFDWIEGGFEREPKHISPEVLRLFLKIKDTYHMGMVIFTLQKAIENIWNNGFYAFSKSKDWKEPYKAKLVDLNSQMINILIEVYRMTKDDFFLEYAIKTGDWLLSIRDRDGHFPVGVFEENRVGGHYLSVNAMAIEALNEIYTVTGDEKYLLKPNFTLNHNLHDLSSPLFLYDIVFLLRLLEKRKNYEEVKKILELLIERYYGNNAFYDVTEDFARENRIGRYQFLYDNSILGQILLKIGKEELAKNIATTLASSYYIYTYFNQAEFAILLGELYGFFT